MKADTAETATHGRLLVPRRIVQAALLSLAIGGAARAEDITLMAGPSGSTLEALSGALKAMIETEAPDLSVSIRPGGGVSNVKALQSGQGDIAWVHSLVSLDAINGRPPFEGPGDNICYLASLHQSALYFITIDPEVNDLADVRGKSLGTLARGNTSELIVQQLLALEGIKEEDLAQYNQGTMSDLADMMKDGHVAVWIVTSGIPTGVITDLMTSRPDARILPISDALLGKLREASPAWHADAIKGGTYPHQEEDVPTAAFSTLIGASCSGLSEQAGYEITKSLIKHYKDLGAVISEINDIEPKGMVADIGIPIHPGAQRAYEEAGLM
jgi:hypothetical protein